MRSNEFTKTARRLTAAEGYLELGMPKHALEELESVEDAGVLEAPRQYMIGYARKTQGEFAAAIPAFEKAARMMPSAQRRLAWKALSSCYRECGSDKLADLAESLAGPAKETPSVTVRVPRGCSLTVTLRAADQPVDTSSSAGPEEING